MNFLATRVHTRAMAKRTSLYLMPVIAATAAVVVPATESFAKGTPWDIKFDSDADADGGDLELKITLDNGTVVQKVFNNMPGGTTRDEKRDHFITEFNNHTVDLNQVLDAAANGTGQISVQVHDDWADDNQIDDFEVTEVETGERVTGQRDDPVQAAFPIVDVRVDITGTGIDREDGTTATAILGVGWLPTPASVPTLGLTGDMIEQNLVSAFNSVFSPEYVASHTAGVILIQDIPCPIGTLFGTDDNGLTYKHTMTVSHFIPTASNWGIVVLLLLVCAAGTIVFRRFRAAPA